MLDTKFKPIVGEKWMEEISKILIQVFRCFDSKGNYDILCEEPWETIILSYKPIVKPFKHEILIKYYDGENSLYGRHISLHYEKSTAFRVDKKLCWKIFYLDSVKFSKKSIPKSLKFNEKYLLSIQILKNFQSIISL